MYFEGRVAVTLLEDYQDLDEGFEFKVEAEELWTADDISERRKNINNFVEVDFYDEVRYVETSLLKEIIDRLY